MKKLMLAQLILLVGLQGCDAKGFSEDQKIPGPVDIGQEWVTVEPDRPLQINREGLQRLHLVVDSELYTSNSDHSDELANDPAHLFDLRTQSDDLVVPEVVMVSVDGTEIPLGSRGNIYLYEGGLTAGMGVVPNVVHEASPPFPEGIVQFEFFRVRNDVPFTVDYFWWKVDRHPDMFR